MSKKISSVSLAELCPFDGLVFERFNLTCAQSCGVHCGSDPRANYPLAAPRGCFSLHRSPVTIAIPDLQGLVSHFGKFIASTSSETLSVILQREAAFILSEMHVPNTELVYQPWYYLNNRLQRQPKTLPEFIGYLDELDSLVRGYINNYLFPVFDRMPKPIREKLSGNAHRELRRFSRAIRIFLKPMRCLWPKGTAFVAGALLVLWISTTEAVVMTRYSCHGICSQAAHLCRVDR